MRYNLHIIKGTIVSVWFHEFDKPSSSQDTRLFHHSRKVPSCPLKSSFPPQATTDNSNQTWPLEHISYKKGEKTEVTFHSTTFKCIQGWWPGRQQEVWQRKPWSRRPGFKSHTTTCRSVILGKSVNLSEPMSEFPKWV